MQQNWRRPFFFMLRPALSEIPFVFGTMVCRSSMIPWWVFIGFAKFQRIVSVNDFWLAWRLQEFWPTSLRLKWSLRFTRIILNPLNGKILYHDWVSMIVPRFTSFVEDFVTSCNQITKLFCQRYRLASAPSARSPCNFGSLADLHFFWTFLIWVMRNLCGCWHFCILEILCEVLQPFGNTLAAVSSKLLVAVLPQLPRYFATLWDPMKLVRSCGCDVEEELVLEFDDSPGTAKGTEFSVLQNVCFPFWSDVARDHWATRECNRVLCKACQGTIRQECLNATAQWRKKEHAHGLVLLHSSNSRYNCDWGVREPLRVSNSSELKSFLLNMCTEAPESITNCRSSGFVEEGVRIT